MFDTHCHLNFNAFEGKIDQVIDRALNEGVNYFVIPGTDVESSKKAVELAKEFEGVYAAVGIHPHHIFKLKSKSNNDSGQARMTNSLNEIEKLLSHPKVVAVGEVGLDRHYYQKTKYNEYRVDESFIELQKLFFLEQMKLAYKYKKALIIHNREAKEELLKILTTNCSLLVTVPTVFHCCEPDEELLDFAIKHNIYIGVDGDVTYWKDKQDFVREIPLERLVLETDSPFLPPEPLRSQKKFPNEPKNLKIISVFISKLKGISEEELNNITEVNTKKLFRII